MAAMAGVMRVGAANGPKGRDGGAAPPAGAARAVRLFGFGTAVVAAPASEDHGLGGVNATQPVPAADFFRGGTQ